MLDEINTGATETPHKSTYMDNSTDSIDDNDEGVELYCQL